MRHALAAARLDLPARPVQSSGGRTKKTGQLALPRKSLLVHF